MLQLLVKKNTEHMGVFPAPVPLVQSICKLPMLFDFILKMTDLGSGLLSGCILSWNYYMHHTLQFEKRNLDSGHTCRYTNSAKMVTALYLMKL